MYTIPNFAGDGGRGGSAGGNMLPAMGGSNQYMNFPSMGTNNFGAGYGGGISSGMHGPLPALPRPGGGPVQPTGYPMPGAQNTPGAVPQAPSIPTGQYPGLHQPPTASKSGGFALQGGAATAPPLNPQLTDIWGNFLQQQLGQGLTPFNLSSYLPSTGGTTGPGQLTAPLTPTMSGLEQFFAGQGGGPNPYTLPLWQSQLQAMQYPIQENLANIKEQFAQQGALGSSEMARALTDYGTQTALGQQALLGQETMQALPLQMGFGQGLQGLDQQAIQNMYQEFMRTQPQYNPLLQDIQSMATSFPPVYTKQGGVGSALIGAAGPAMQGLAALIPALAAI